VCLPWAKNHPAHTLNFPERALVIGWGKVTNESPETAQNYEDCDAAACVLQKLSVPVLDGRCNGDFDITARTQVCAGGEPGILNIVDSKFTLIILNLVSFLLLTNLMVISYY